MDEQDVKKEFVRMTMDLMRQAEEYFDASDIPPKLLREIRKNVRMILTMD